MSDRSSDSTDSGGRKTEAIDKAASKLQQKLERERRGASGVKDRVLDKAENVLNSLEDTLKKKAS